MVWLFVVVVVVSSRAGIFEGRLNDSFPARALIFFYLFFSSRDLAYTNFYL